jgi:hypothetical protein
VETGQATTTHLFVSWKKMEEAPKRVPLSQEAVVLLFCAKQRPSPLEVLPIEIVRMICSFLETPLVFTRVYFARPTQPLESSVVISSNARKISAYKVDGWITAFVGRAGRSSQALPAGIDPLPYLVISKGRHTFNFEFAQEQGLMAVGVFSVTGSKLQEYDRTFSVMSKLQQGNSSTQTEHYQDVYEQGCRYFTAYSDGDTYENIKSESTEFSFALFLGRLIASYHQH